MGLGRYKDGKFDLVLSVRHDADADRLALWEASFRRASELLYDSTDGQMQLGRVYCANDSRGTSEADAFLMEEEGKSFTTTPIPGLGTPDLHVVLKGDERKKPFIVVHELAHYLYAVWDEYEDATRCTNDTSTGACIMEWGWGAGDTLEDDGTLVPGLISEFCTVDNHDPDGGTEQEANNGESCWETIVGAFSDVSLPSGLPDTPAPAGHDTVEWIMLADAARFSLVLDRSGSMSTGNAIAGVRFGADYWVRYLKETGDELSVVQYNHDPDDILPHTLLTASTDLDPTLSAIAGITASGDTNIGGALSRGMDHVLSPGDQAATQVLVLFSDGLHNTGTDPATVLPDLVDNGIRVYTIGFGPGADQALLETIAADTGGRFEQIDAAPDSAAAQLEIQNHLIEISGEVREGSGIVTMTPGLLGEPVAGEPDSATEAAELQPSSSPTAIREALAKRPFHFRPRPRGVDHRAHIEAGSIRATFVVSHLIGTEVGFHLVRPDGSIVDPSSDPSVTFVDPKGTPYAFYLVRDPMPGTWIMRLSRRSPRGTIPFKVFAFSENPGLSLAVTGTRRLHRAGADVELGIQAVALADIVGTRPPRVTVTRAGNRKLREPVKVTPGAVGFDASGRPRRGSRSGFTAKFNAPEPGRYEVTIEMVNTGRARQEVSIGELLEDGDHEVQLPAPPPFVRTHRVQVHVGPLSTGAELEKKQ